LALLSTMHAGASPCRTQPLTSQLGITSE